MLEIDCKGDKQNTCVLITYGQISNVAQNTERWYTVVNGSQIRFSQILLEKQNEYRIVVSGEGSQLTQYPLEKSSSKKVLIFKKS